MFQKQRRRGERTPLDDEPKVEDELLDLWHAFTSLNRSRTVIGGVPQPVTQQELLAFATMSGWLDWQDLVELRIVVSELDQVLLEYRATNGEH